MVSAVVHAGTLGRWFEELCRIKVQKLRDLVRPQTYRLRTDALPSSGGVYCYWWSGSRQKLRDKACNREIELVGPGGRAVRLSFDDEWLGLSTDLPVPLYVGKTADSLFKRLKQHLLLDRPRVTLLFEGQKKQARPTTSCQARAGVEHLFPGVSDTRDLVLDDLGLSYIVLDGDQHAANRFYLEDLAIGLMRPALNIDIER
ncbi:MAG: hypothetical protein AAB016_12930 [candidate division NC10 bacterium]